jgi:cation diffusion facilitator CzcD-associated flavoprotein CzcO
MLVESEGAAALVEPWLAKLESGLAGRDVAALQKLFHADSHWRDVLALTWRIGTVSGGAAVARGLTEHVRSQPSGFCVDPGRTAPREVTRAGEKCIEAIFRFETADGPANGVVRFKGDRAWTLMTALDDFVTEKKQPKNEEPAVLIVGGGHAGLSIAARLAQRGIAARIVDRWPRVGDNWRRRYGVLRLHNQVYVNHLPFLRYPDDFPVYIPKDQLADWFETYAQRMALDYWTGAEFQGGTYDADEKRWSVKIQQNGKTRELHPRHVVLATGVSGIPSIPDIPALKGFAGKVIHSSQYDDAAAWKGKRAVVIGTGTSGHDIAQDLHSAGAQVTIVQRSPTLVINVEPSAQLVYSIYHEGPPLEDCDLVTVSVPLKLAKKAHQLASDHAKRLDRDLLDKLAKKGFRLDYGEDNTGWQFKYLTRGGGYYFNVGCSDLIVEGKIRLAQFSDLERLLPDADLVVLATGYKGQEALVSKLFGEDVARRVGPIWGFGDDQELRNMFQRTPQPGLWFIAGSFAQCRIYSKYLALQIQATEAGLMRDSV